MNILVIKQTSLGDVLHSTGHVRALKQHFKDCTLTVLTATTSAEIYRHSPWVDRLILLDYYRIKRDWNRNPSWCYRHIRSVVSEMNELKYDLAFDLQGLARSVIFLYLADACCKFVKGRWLGLFAYRQPSEHAIEEMNGVLDLAGIKGVDTSMEFVAPKWSEEKVDLILQKINNDKPIWIFSAFSRWPSKDWPLENYVKVAQAISHKATVFFTGTENNRSKIEQALAGIAGPSIVNMAGQLLLGDFAALTARADGMLTGDSFPMHIASAQKTTVIALFAPTDEKRVGPTGTNDQVVRALGCERCDRKYCDRGCLSRIDPQQVIELIEQRLDSQAQN